MTATEHALGIAAIAAQAGADKLGENMVAFDVSDQLGIADIFLIVSARNERQVGAIVDNIEAKLLDAGEKPIGREGAQQNRWVLLDYADLVIHVQHAEERALFSLERLWRDCPAVPLHLVEVASLTSEVQ